MRFAVCDDEPELRRSISDNIKLFSPGAAITEFSSGKELLASASGFDIIFLDIGMDGLDGMQTARELRKSGCNSAIIFVTAFEDKVFDAFDVGAFHYLVKPVSIEKFAEVLKNAIDSRTEPVATDTGDRFIAVKSGGVSTKLALSEIMYAEVYDRILILHTISGKVEYRGKLSGFEKCTDETFFRTHRSYLINLRYLESYTSSQVKMDSGDTVILAKQRYSELVRAYMRFLKQGDGNGIS